MCDIRATKNRLQMVVLATVGSPVDNIV